MMSYCRLRTTSDDDAAAFDLGSCFNLALGQQLTFYGEVNRRLNEVEFDTFFTNEIDHVTAT